jgi:hypothetical protein
MISLALKHKVCEWCIDAFFSHVKKNFSQSDIPREGEFFKRITMDAVDMTYALMLYSEVYVITLKLIKRR